jgi:hypothetical protein
VKGSIVHPLRAQEHRVVAVHVAPAVKSTQRPLNRDQRALVALESLVSVCGLGGGAFMASRPMTMMPLRYLEGTFFHTWRWPGLALLFFVGILPALAVVATLQRRRIEMVGHFGVGVGLVAWILLEATWVVVSLPSSWPLALLA